MSARSLPIRKTTEREFAASQPRLPDGVVIVPTEYPIAVCATAGLTSMSISNEFSSFTLNLVPRFIAEKTGVPFFESYAEALRGIRQGLVRKVSSPVVESPEPKAPPVFGSQGAADA